MDSCHHKYFGLGGLPRPGPSIDVCFFRSLSGHRTPVVSLTENRCRRSYWGFRLCECGYHAIVQMLQFVVQFVLNAHSY